EGQEQREPQQHLVGRGLAGAERLTQDAEHDDDAGEGRHGQQQRRQHGDRRRRQQQRHAQQPAHPAHAPRLRRSSAWKLRPAARGAPGCGGATSSGSGSTCRAFTRPGATPSSSCALPTRNSTARSLVPSGTSASTSSSCEQRAPKPRARRTTVASTNTTASTSSSATTTCTSSLTPPACAGGTDCGAANIGL